MRICKHTKCSVCDERPSAWRAVGKRDTEGLCMECMEKVWMKMPKAPDLFPLDPCKCNRSDYWKEHYAKNKERILLRQASYYQRNKEKYAATHRAYREKNREKMRVYWRERKRAERNALLDRVGSGVNSA